MSELVSGEGRQYLHSYDEPRRKPVPYCQPGLPGRQPPPAYRAAVPAKCAVDAADPKGASGPYCCFEFADLAYRSLSHALVHIVQKELHEKEIYMQDQQTQNS